MTVPCTKMQAGKVKQTEYSFSWDKKKSPNLSGQKNHPTSWGEKITQPLGTKKNHPTSWEKTRPGDLVMPDPIG